VGRGGSGIEAGDIHPFVRTIAILKKLVINQNEDWRGGQEWSRRESNKQQNRSLGSEYHGL